MIVRTLFRTMLLALFTVAVAIPTQAALLSVDFQNTTVSTVGVTQSGFQAFTDDGTPTGSETRTFGSYNITISGHQSDIAEGFFNRGGVTNGGALTYADIYNDFVFKNEATVSGAGSASMTLSLSGAGIAASTLYQMTFYSYDSDDDDAVHSMTFTGSTGTTGSAGPLVWTAGNNPTTNNQYAVTGTFTSNGSGVLTIDMSDSWTGSASLLNGIRLNAFELAVVPEPASFGLLAVGLVALCRLKRRTR